MSFDEEIRATTAAILNTRWSERESAEVPKTDDVVHRNGAVKIEAAFLYADLAGSSDLQQAYLNPFVAKALRMYLDGTCRIIRKFGGSIKSFDGDRVMGVFAGNAKRNDAVRAAYAIEWLVQDVINPLVKKRHESNCTKVWIADHGVGIDCGEVFIARAGVRNRSGEHNHNDLIFVGKAPNVAAKLSSLRHEDRGPIVITSNVYRYLKEEQKKFVSSDRRIWTGPRSEAVGPYAAELYRTGYWRQP